MRRIYSLLAAVIMSIMLSSCGAETTAPHTIRIGVALYQQEDTFISTVAKELQRTAQEAEQDGDVKINLYFADGKGSQTVQNEQIDRFLDREYDVICINIVDRTAAAVIIDKAQAADIPVIFFNRQPVEEDLRRWEHAYYVGLPAGDAGSMQGQLVLDAWRADQKSIDKNGDGVLQYVMLEGEAGHQDALLRTEQCVAVLTEAGVPVERLASETANWQRGQAALRMRQWLQKGGEYIEVVFANNDDMALGAIDAWLEAGLSLESLPFIVGVDATPPALEALQDGTLKGTVRNDAVGLAEGLMQLITSFSDGYDISSTVDLTDEHYLWLQYEPVTLQTLQNK